MIDFERIAESSFKAGPANAGGGVEVAAAITAFRDPATGSHVSILRQAPMPVEAQEAWIAFRKGVGRNWFNALYVIGRVSEPVSEARFRRILEALAIQHRVLRMRVCEHGEGLYLAETDAELQIEIIDGNGLDDAATDDLISELTWRDFAYYEDLAVSENLFRAFLINRADRPDICGMVFHHQIADYVSIRNLRFDFRKLFFKDVSTVGKDPKPQYQVVDHIKWLGDLVSSPEGADLVGEFKATRKDANVALANAGLAQREDVTLTRVSVDPAVVAAVNKRSAESGVPVFVFVIAAQALAHKLCYSMDHVPINLMLHGRTDLNSFRAIGCFVMRRPVWIDIPRHDCAIEEFLRSVERELKSRVNLPPIEYLFMTRPGGEVLNYVDNTGSQVIPPFLDNIDPKFIGTQQGSHADILKMFAKPSLLRMDKNDSGMSITHITRWNDKAGSDRYVTAFLNSLHRLGFDLGAPLGASDSQP